MQYMSYVLNFSFIWFCLEFDRWKKGVHFNHHPSEWLGVGIALRAQAVYCVSSSRVLPYYLEIHMLKAMVVCLRNGYSMDELVCQFSTCLLPIKDPTPPPLVWDLESDIKCHKYIYYGINKQKHEMTNKWNK